MAVQPCCAENLLWGNERGGCGSEPDSSYGPHSVPGCQAFPSPSPSFHFLVSQSHIILWHSEYSNLYPSHSQARCNYPYPQPGKARGSYSYTQQRQASWKYGKYTPSHSFNGLFKHSSQLQGKYFSKTPEEKTKLQKQAEPAEWHHL